MDRRRGYSIFKIAAAYIGTVVGAGFASGQEVLQFFGYFGFWGLIGLGLATVLFVLFGYAFLAVSHELEARSYLPVLHLVGGPWLGRAVDGIATFFLFGALAVMAAGAGAIFREEYHLSPLLGSMLLIGFTLITVLLGINRVITSISFISPLLVATVLGVSILTIFRNPSSLLSHLFWSDLPKAVAPSWLLAAILYTSYNLVLAIAVLAPLGALSRSPNLWPGALLGGTGLGLGALAILLALLTTVPQVTAWEVPMLHIAANLSPKTRIFYSAILLAEIYTTAVSSLYGFTARLADPESKKFSYLAALASLVALVASQLGFSRLVATLFPLVGYGGFLLLGALAKHALRRRFLETINSLLVKHLPFTWSSKIIPRKRR